MTTCRKRTDHRPMDGHDPKCANLRALPNAMGDKSNEFHREVVRPKVTELLSPNPADYILDIACGNGNYSSYLAQRGASVVAFDYSKKMIELAKRRQSQYAKQIGVCQSFWPPPSILCSSARLSVICLFKSSRSARISSVGGYSIRSYFVSAYLLKLKS